MRSFEELFVAVQIIVIDLGKIFIFHKIRNIIVFFVILNSNKVNIAIARVFCTEDNICAFFVVFKRNKSIVFFTVGFNRSDKLKLNHRAICTRCNKSHRCYRKLAEYYDRRSEREEYAVKRMCIFIAKAK